MLCSYGEYLADTDTGTCAPCSAGRYQPNTDSPETECSYACPAGKYLEDDGNDASLHDSADDCSDCPVGRSSGWKNGLAECAICESGRYSADTGANRCSNCSEGSYLFDAATDASLHDEADDCTVCPAGTYVSTTGASNWYASAQRVCTRDYSSFFSPQHTHTTTILLLTLYLATTVKRTRTTLTTAYTR